MCKLSSYSKYQKRVIKFLNDLLGTETPFSYERTQTNHLKVLIDGVPKPIFTGSTPSDCKSINNFMAEVKRELRASKQEPEQTEQTEQKEKPRLPFQLSNDKLIQGCVKSLRTRIETLKSQEEALVLEHKNVEGINKARMDTVKHAVSFALQSRKSGAYLKRKEMKEIEDTVMRHLNFMLPTAACYAELLDSKNKYQPKSGGSLHVETVRNSDKAEESRSSNVVKIDENVQVTDTSTDKKQTETNDGQKQSRQDSASELMAMSADNRVSLLRNLPKAQALSLIDDINQALALNREQDIEAVVNLMRDKDLPLEAIISRLEAA